MSTLNEPGVGMKKLWRVVALSIAVLALSAGYLWMRQTAAIGSARYDVTELVASRSRLTKSAVARGLVKPKVGAEVKVGSQVSGIVKRMLVSVGETVQRGQILAELDDAQKVAQINTIKEQLNVIQVRRDYADSELQRLLKIGAASRGLVSPQLIDEQRQKVRLSEAEYRQTLAQLREAEVVLGYTQITAPIDGTIASISTYKGETVAASFAAPTFVMIIDLSRQEIQAYVDEADIGQVHVGQQVEFRLESYPGRVLQGVVQAVNPKPEVVNNVVNYVVLIDFTQPDDMLVRPEMTVRVDFVLDVRENAIVISGKALMREDSIDFVVVRHGDRWKKQAVKTGLRDSGKIEILSGLNEGDIYLADKNDWKTIAGQASD